MHLLLLTTIVGLSTCAIIRQPINHTDNTHVKDAIDREIMEALKSIDETKKTIETSKNTVQHQLEESDDRSIGGEMKWLWSSMIDAVRDVHIPFLTRISGNETRTSVATTSTPKNASQTHDFMQKTREEMRKDVELLRTYYMDIRMEFDEWVISNKHQNFKSMLIGALSALVVLVFYWIIVKCCLRRTRGHLSSFAIDRSSAKNGDNQWLLGEDPSIAKRNHRYPSNSDEDI